MLPRRKIEEGGSGDVHATWSRCLLAAFSAGDRGSAIGTVCNPAGPAIGTACSPAGPAIGTVCCLAIGTVCSPTGPAIGTVCSPAGPAIGTVCSPAGPAIGTVCGPAIGIVCNPAGPAIGTVCSLAVPVNSTVCGPAIDIVRSRLAWRLTLIVLTYVARLVRRFDIDAELHPPLRGRHVCLCRGVVLKKRKLTHSCHNVYRISIHSALSLEKG